MEEIMLRTESNAVLCIVFNPILPGVGGGGVFGTILEVNSGRNKISQPNFLTFPENM